MSGESVDALVFAFGITGPVLLLLMAGWGLRRVGMIDVVFVSDANALVFKVALPALLFLSIATGPLDAAFDVRLTAVGVGGTLLLIAVLLAIGRLLPSDQRGVFVQGAYRGNLAILGLALAVTTYGEKVLPLAAVYIAVVTTLYNVVAVWLLDSSGALRQIATNPIILGIVAGALVSLTGLPVPVVLARTGDYLANMALPLALLCIGASLDVSSLRDHGRAIALATLFKLIVSPLLLVGLGIQAGLEGTSLGVLFFLAASPTASASYIMARQMTVHGPLAAEIIAVTTALGVLSYTVGLTLLRGAGLI